VRLTFVAILVAGPLAAQGASPVLELRPARPGSPNVMAANDPAAALDTAFRPLNPFLYECVAFLRVRLPRGDGGTVPSLEREGPLAWRRDVLWVSPATNLAQRRRPRLAAIVGGNRQFLMVTLDPGDSRLQYVVAVDSAAVTDSAGTETVRRLVSAPFSIPPGELEQCGRVPDVNVKLLAPDGEHPGFNINMDVTWRRPIRLVGGGLIELGIRGASTSAGRSTLLNSITTGGRVELKLNRGYRHWVSFGVTERFEATERFDVVDLALGAAVRLQLDFLPVARLRPLLRRFTPFPMLNIEYNLVDRLKGAGPNTEHRLRGGFEWSVPMILGTTLRAELRADYMISNVPAGTRRLRTVNDVSLEYPLGLAEDLALVVQWLDGRAAPTYEVASRWLMGVGIRR